MANRYVDFISDEHFIDCIKFLYEKYKKAQLKTTKKDILENKLDIFKLTFDKSFINLSDEELIKIETARQIDKTVSTHIGTFHEMILAGISGFEKLESGCDIKSSDDKIFIELKNKHNTVKGEDQKSIFTKLKENYIDKYPNSKAYYARILDTSSQSKIWKFTAKGVSYSNDNIFIISGDKLYELMTGKKDALFQLYNKLPLAIADYLSSLENNSASSQDNSSVNNEQSAIEALRKDIRESQRSMLDEITYISFNYYLGFDKL